MNHLKKLVNYCRELLISFPEAELVRTYANSRVSKDSQEKFCFGYFPTKEQLDILISEIGYEELSKLGLIFDKVIQDGLLQKTIRYSTMQDHNFVLPYRDVYGNVIAIVGRSILTDEERKAKGISKYKNTSFDKKHHLFGLYEAKDSIIKNNLVYIVEGQIDVISAHDKGLDNVIALGSSNMTFDQFALLMRYTNNLVLLLDNDDAGNAGSEKIITNFSNNANIIYGELPKGYKDIDELIKDVGLEGFSYKLKDR